MKLNHILKKTLPLLLFLGICSMSSCKKMLDIKPSDQLDQADVFSSVAKLEMGVTGVYEGWYPEYALRIGTLMADECRIGPQNSGVSSAGQNLFRWTFSSVDEEILAPWKNDYTVIDRVNRLLKGLPAVPVKNEKEAGQLKAIKGELLAIRACLHFELYQVYAYSGVYRAEAYAVPYMLESSISSQPSRPLSAAFFDLFYKDLDNAEPLLNNDSNVRLGLNALWALRARAALYTQKYNEAVLYAGKVIKQVPLAGRSGFEAIWTDQNNAEVIFKLKRTGLSKIKPGDLFYNISADRMLFVPSVKLMALYDPVADVRYTSWFKTDSSLPDKGELAQFISKYQGEKGTLNLRDLKLFRTGEMYLVRAEAALYNGDQQMAEKDLNTLRTARIQGYSDQHFKDKNQLQAALSAERFKELPYEGQRYFDLKRQNLPMERSAEDAESSFLALAPDALHYYIPIPQSEVMANPNIRPNNKGW